MISLVAVERAIYSASVDESAIQFEVLMPISKGSLQT
jgi:hypothetical protein